MTVTYYSGRVHTVVYEDPASAFYILKITLDTTGDDLFGLVQMASVAPPVTVKGNVPGLPVKVGTWFGFEAKQDDHPTYGKQLAIVRAPVLKDGWTPETASKTLSANGVSGLVVQSIRHHVGDDGFLATLASVEKLEEVPGLGTFSAQHVHARWNFIQTYFKALAFLNGLGLPPSCIKDVWTKFGDKAEEVLASNPWALVRVDGISFKQADEIGRRLGLNDLPKRVQGAVLYACKTYRSFGHLYLRTGSILQAVQADIYEAAATDVAPALAALHKDGLVVIDKTTRPGTTAVYEPWSYHMEKQSADLLVKRTGSAALVPGSDRTRSYVRALASVGPLTDKLVTDSIDDPDILMRTVRSAVEEWGSQAHLQLSDDQKLGIVHALSAPVSVLSGLPGTGKTTSLKAAVNILEGAGVQFLLVAPTGIAAKNLQARTGADASTIHRAFSAKGVSDDKRDANYTGVVGESRTASGGEDDWAWGYGGGKTHPAQVVIIDEASMVDQHLLYRLLDCTSEHCRLVFVGDHAQLPSVGPGNVLRDLIESKMFPTVKLMQIFRQEDTSGIVFAAHAIHAGNVPDLNKDFQLIPLGSEDEVLERLLKVVGQLYEDRENFQVLSPRHAGTVGVTSLNARLRDMLNPKGPGTQEIRISEDTIREDDRVMIIRNDYKLGVFNGDVGKIVKVDRTKKEVEIKIFGSPPLFVSVSFKDVPKLLRLAYACTVHKAQGLEYDHIVMPLVTGFSHQLQRNLLYTAITRARQRVVLIGHRDALAAAVANAKEDLRATLFLDRLRGGSQPVASG